jgi:hypothetical protein
MLFGFYNKFVKFQSNILRCFPDIKIKKNISFNIRDYELIHKTY